MARLTGGGTRIHFLDALRGLAALLVLVGHLPVVARPPLEVPGWLSPLVGYGTSGVTLFFIVSAISLCISTRDVQWTFRDIISFYTRRFFRIAPLFYIVSALSVLNHFRFYGQFPSKWEIISNFTFMFNLTPAYADSLTFAGWTIGVEFVFYIVFPFLRLATKNPVSEVALLVAGTLSYEAFLATLTRGDPTYQRYALLTILLYGPSFVAGLILHDIDARRLHSINPRAGYIFLGLFCVAYSWLSTHPIDMIGFHQAHVQTALYALLLLGFTSIQVPGHALAPLRAVGLVSYSMYLLHGHIISVLNRLFPALYEFDIPLLLKFASAAVLTMAACLAVSFLSYRLIEWPGILCGKAVIVHWYRTRPALTKIAK